MKPIVEKHKDIMAELETKITPAVQEEKAHSFFINRLEYERSKAGKELITYARNTPKREAAYHDENPSDGYIDYQLAARRLTIEADYDFRRTQLHWKDAALPGTNLYSFQKNLGLMPRPHFGYNARIDNRYTPERFKLRESCQMAAADHFEAEQLKQAVLRQDVEVVKKLWAKTGLDDGRDFNLYVEHVASGYRGRA